VENFPSLRTNFFRFTLYATIISGKLDSDKADWVSINDITSQKIVLQSGDLWSVFNLIFGSNKSNDTSTDNKIEQKESKEVIEQKESKEVTESNIEYIELNPSLSYLGFAYIVIQCIVIKDANLILSSRTFSTDASQQSVLQLPHSIVLPGETIGFACSRLLYSRYQIVLHDYSLLKVLRVEHNPSHRIPLSTESTTSPIQRNINSDGIRLTLLYNQEGNVSNLPTGDTWFNLETITKQSNIEEFLSNVLSSKYKKIGIIQT